MAATVSRYAADPTEEHLFAVLAFPKLVLRASHTRGRTTADALSAALRHRIHQFQMGELRALWHDFSEELARYHQARPMTRAQKRARTTSASKIGENELRRARILVGEGATRKALDGLMSEGAHDPADPAVLDRLRELHPDGSPVSSTLPATLDPLVVGAGQDGFWDNLVRDAILRFPRASAPGPSGLRPAHLQDALRRRGGGLGLVRALAQLTHAWATGQLPATHSKFLCGATLTPLKKADGGVRPVAVGETIRRLVGKALLATCTAKAQVDPFR